MFVCPILEYAVASWDPHTESGKNRLERVQRKAIRIVYQNFDRDKFSTDNLLLERKWMSLEDRRKIIRLTTLHKCKTGYPGLQELQEHLKNPNYLSARVDHKYKIKEIPAVKNQYKHSFLPRTIKDWNALPEKLFVHDKSDNLVETTVFRNRLRTHFQAQCDVK